MYFGDVLNGLLLWLIQAVPVHHTGCAACSSLSGAALSDAAGGLLYNQAMERFMPDYDDRLELAPRDVVARSIYDQMLKRNETHVLLDISHKKADEVKGRHTYSGSAGQDVCMSLCSMFVALSQPAAVIQLVAPAPWSRAQTTGWAILCTEC